MSVQNSTNRFPFDALLALEPFGSSNITATGASTNTLSLDVLSSYWASGDVAQDFQFAVVTEVNAWDHTTGDETYVQTLQVCATSGFGSGVVTVATQAITGIGRYVSVVTREQIAAALAGATTGFLRVEMTLGGTTPILGYFAYASPMVG